MPFDVVRLYTGYSRKKNSWPLRIPSRWEIHILLDLKLGCQFCLLGHAVVRGLLAWMDCAVSTTCLWCCHYCYYEYKSALLQLQLRWRGRRKKERKKERERERGALLLRDATLASSKPMFHQKVVNKIVIKKLKSSCFLTLYFLFRFLFFLLG